MKGPIGVMLGAMLFLSAGATWAQGQGAEQPAPKAAAEPSAATAEVKAGTGYQSYAVVGEAASFPAGTLVFAVSTVSGADGTTVKHVWKKEGTELWTASLPIGSSRWTTSSRRLLKQPGQYSVSVLSAEGVEIGKIEFTVQ